MGAFFQMVVKAIPVIVAAIGAVEKLSDKKGKDKQDAAVAIVGDLIPLIEATIPREIVDESQVQDAIRKVIDAIVALQNVVRDVITKKRAA
jgi:predicted amino acid dehydrogenase